MGLLLYLMTHGFLVYVAALIPAIFFIPKITDRRWILFAVAAVGFLNIKLFFLPDNMPPAVLPLSVFFGMALLGAGLDRSSIHQISPRNRIILSCFILVLIVTAAVRGFHLGGKNAAGMSNYSGGWYIVIAVAAISYWLGQEYSLPLKWFKILILLMVVGGFGMLFLELLLYRTGARFFFLTKFFDINTEWFVQDYFEAYRSIRRYISLILVSKAMLFFSLHAFRVRKFHKGSMLLGLSVFCAMAAGFRSQILIILLAFGLFFLLYARFRARIVVVLGAYGVAGTLMLYALAPAMSETLQRSISFLPGIGIEQQVADQASETVDWRYDLWGRTAEELPKYLLVGRGLTRDYMGAMALYDSPLATDAEVQYYMHAYHSWVLGVLMDLGIVGFVLLTLFLLERLRRIVSRVKIYSDNTSSEVTFVMFSICIYISQTISGTLNAAGIDRFVLGVFMNILLLCVYANSLDAAYSTENRQVVDENGTSPESGRASFSRSNARCNK